MYTNTKITYLKGALAGVVAFVLAMIASNIIFFQIGAPLLFDPSLQSEKVISVLFEQTPLPLMFTNGILYMLLGSVIGALHGLVFVFLLPALPTSTLKRGIAFAAILWILMALYFEFHVPFNMFGEPVWLVVVELLFWVPVLFVEGLTLSFLHDKLNQKKSY